MNVEVRSENGNVRCQSIVNGGTYRVFGSTVGMGGGGVEVGGRRDWKVERVVRMRKVGRAGRVRGRRSVKG